MQSILSYPYTLGPSTSKFSNNNIYTTKKYSLNHSKPLYNPILEDQIWFHGLIKRVEAQNLLKNDGDFLIRNSISNPRGFVLSGKNQGGQILHFEINQTNENGLLYHVSKTNYLKFLNKISSLKTKNLRPLFL